MKGMKIMKDGKVGSGRAESAFFMAFMFFMVNPLRTSW